jgi:hypothetical protein
MPLQLFQFKYVYASLHVPIHYPRGLHPNLEPGPLSHPEPFLGAGEECQIDFQPTVPHICIVSVG